MQIGFETETDFYDESKEFRYGPTSWNIFPTEENPLARYKFVSLQFTFEHDLTVINRQTYSLLDWLGDCGGLLDALLLLGQIFVAPISSFALSTKLMTSLVRLKVSDPDRKDPPSKNET